MTTIEIEYDNGETFCAINIGKHIDIKDIKKFRECDLADEDGDYIFETEDNLIRIQENRGPKCWACGTLLSPCPDEEDKGKYYCPNEMCLMDETVEV